jgi:hypothetical protein
MVRQIVLNPLRAAGLFANCGDVLKKVWRDLGRVKRRLLPGRMNPEPLKPTIWRRRKRLTRFRHPAD